MRNYFRILGLGMKASDKVARPRPRTAPAGTPPVGSQRARTQMLSLCWILYVFCVKKPWLSFPGLVKIAKEK